MDLFTGIAKLSEKFDRSIAVSGAKLLTFSYLPLNLDSWFKH
jgi:hypothetical protein